MKTQCPHCKNVFVLPIEYKGQPVKCPRCEQDFSPEKFKKPPIVVPDNIAREGKSLLEKFWKGIPTSFKAGFLATLGAIAAIFLFLSIYYPLPTTDFISPLEEVTKILANYKLFPDIAANQHSILHGRYLLQHKFLPDINRPHPCLSVYTDKSGNFVGISALWYGSQMGFAAEPLGDKIELYCGNCVCKGILALIDYNPTILKNDSFKIDESISDGLTESFEFSNNSWVIVLTRIPTNLRGSEDFINVCKEYELKPLIYAFSISAHHW